MPTVFTLGTDMSAWAILLPPQNGSTSVSAADQADVVGSRISQGPISTTFVAGARTSSQPTSSAHQSVGGMKQELFGGQLFERMIVIPRQKPLGFVVTATQFNVEVWNTLTGTEEILTAINITGGGGLSLPNPFGLPLPFAPGDSRIFLATMPTSGDPQIDQLAAFVFDSGIPGADIHITGSRIVLFSVAPDWSDGMEETISFLTDVLSAYSDKEQRRGLRQLPRRGLKFRALTLNARDAAGLESLVWGWQQQPYGVPWWPDGGALLADTPAGSFTISVDTTDRQYAAGGLLCIWVDEFTFESLSIVSVGPTSIVVSSPTQLSWSAGEKTRVMPVFLGRLPNSVDVTRYSSEIDEMELEFTGEAQQVAPVPTISPTTFKGFDVLEVAPNWDDPLKRSYKRSLVTIDPKIGPLTVIDKGGSPLVGQPFPWWLYGHSNITAFRAFLFRRFGRLKPFWIPTWDQDLVLASDVASSDTGISIRSEFYSRFFFPNASRRFIAFIPTDGSGNVYRKITSASDNGDGTESLLLESATGKAFAAGKTMVSFLTLARLASDDLTIKWNSAHFAESELSLQEVPRETP